LACQQWLQLLHVRIAEEHIPSENAHPRKRKSNALQLNWISQRLMHTSNFSKKENPMPLLRDIPLKKLTLVYKKESSDKKETKHEKVISSRVKKDKKEFKSIGDMIKHVQNDILKSDGGEIAVRKCHQARVDHSIKHKHLLCCNCGKTCVPVMDEKKSTKSHAVWTKQLKCIGCGEIYEKEVTK